MRILITGSSGFLGGHLVDHLLARGGHAVAGISRTPRDGWYAGDLADVKSLETAIASFRPEWLFHLAGYAHTGKSFREPEACWRANFNGTQNLFRALETTGSKPRVLLASTGLVYGGLEPGQTSHDESSALKPTSPYADSKLAAEFWAETSGKKLGIELVRARLFNSIGPGQAGDFAVPRFARQIAAIERGEQTTPLIHGDLNGERDFTDVRDTVIALAGLMEKGEPGRVYNVGSGRVYRMKTVLNTLIELSGSKIELERDPDLPADTSKSFSNPALLKRTTGWEPKYSLEQTLADVLAEWRGK